jgi:ABC-2 type transport system permease protein
MTFYQLFVVNIKMLYRNWRGLFWNIVLPIGLYIGIASLPFTAPGMKDSPLRYSEYLLPGMIAMTILQTGIFSLAYWLVDLNQRGVVKRLMATPLSHKEFLGSLIASRLVLMVIQVVILILIGKYVFNTTVNGSVIAIIIMLLLGGSIFLSIGFLISTISKSYEEAAPITTIINLIFTFLGNIFYPTSGLNQTLAEFSSYLPITYLAEGIRNNFINSWTLTQSLPTIAALIVWLVIMFIITTSVFKTKQSQET